MRNIMPEFFASTAKGLSEVLETELKELGVQKRFGFLEVSSLRATGKRVTRSICVLE